MCHGSSKVWIGPTINFDELNTKSFGVEFLNQWNTYIPIWMTPSWIILGYYGGQNILGDGSLCIRKNYTLPASSLSNQDVLIYTPLDNEVDSIFIDDTIIVYNTSQSIQITQFPVISNILIYTSSVL